MNSVRIELSLLLGDVEENTHTGFLPEIVLSFCKDSKRIKETSLEIASKGESMVSGIMVLAMELERHGYILKTESS